MAARPAAGSGGRRGRSRSRGATPWLQGLVCGLIATFATPTAALAAGLLAPAIITFMVDAAEGRALTRTVLLSGLAAAARPMLTLWNEGHNMDVAMALLSEPANLVVAWAAQGAAWLLVQTLPVVITASFNAQTAARVARLRAARAELEAEWGLPPGPLAEDVSAQPPA